MQAISLNVDHTATLQAEKDDNRAESRTFFVLQGLGCKHGTAAVPEKLESGAHAQPQLTMEKIATHALKA